MKRVRWFVIFEDVVSDSPFRRLLRAVLGYPRHCYAVAEAEGGMLLVAQSVQRLEVEYVPGLTAEAWAAFCRSERGLRVEVAEADVDDRTWVPSFRNCVATTRALVGLPVRWQTARRLAAELAGRREV